jgi:hypothetical protein
MIHDRQYDLIIRKALEYPFELRQNSFVLIGHRLFDIRHIDFGSLMDSTALTPDGQSTSIAELAADMGIPTDRLDVPRTPVIAFGSNASPVQLRTKFPAKDEIFLVCAAEIRDIDVVYSAHFSRYGSIPANLLSSAGTTARVFVTYLDHRQLIQMHESEARNYDPVMLHSISLLINNQLELTDSMCYLSRHGCLTLDGAPVRLAAFPASGAHFRAYTEQDLLEIYAKRLAPGTPVNTFIRRLVDDEPFRKRCKCAVKRDATPFDWPHWSSVEYTTK